MRYPTGQKEQTRERILEAAAVVFRREGFGAGSVDKIMAEAGLTAGGFYAHFKNKDALFAEMLAHALRQASTIYGKHAGDATGAERVRSIAARYLSPQHRRAIDAGCVMPPLLAELPRTGGAAQRTFQTELEKLAGSLAPHISADANKDATDRALATIALMVGGMTLARAVADESLADRILAACRDWIESSSKPVRPKHKSETARRKSISSSHGKAKPTKGEPKP